MKKLISLVGFTGCIMMAISQTPSVCISASKTTILVFPFPVTHVDRGSKDILVTTSEGSCKHITGEGCGQGYT